MGSALLQRLGIDDELAPPGEVEDDLAVVEDGLAVGFLAVGGDQDVDDELLVLDDDDFVHEQDGGCRRSKLPH